MKENVSATFSQSIRAQEFRIYVATSEYLGKKNPEQSSEEINSWQEIPTAGLPSLAVLS